MFKIFIYSVLIFSALCSVTYANDQYVVRNIAVDAQGEGALQARDNALVKARKNAYGVLLKRLYQGDDGKIPQTPDDSKISTMINNFEINREKSSRNRYMASVNITFNERAVQAYMGRNTNAYMPDTAQLAVDRVHNDRRVQGGINNENRNQSTLTTQYKSAIDVHNIHQLVKVKAMLQDVPMMNHVVMNSLNAKRAVITLYYSGGAQQLQDGLVARGLQIYSNPQAAASDAPYILMARRS